MDLAVPLPAHGYGLVMHRKTAGRWATIATTASAVVLGGPAAALAVPAKDRVEGSATNQYPTPAGLGSSRLTIRARTDASGLASGTATGEGTPTGTPEAAFRVSGVVTCVRVSGNRASIKYRFDEASGSAAALQGGGIEVYVEDNRGHTADANAFDPPQPPGAFNAAATQCDDPNTATYDTVESGGYKVRGGRVDATG